MTGTSDAGKQPAGGLGGGKKGDGKQRKVAPLREWPTWKKSLLGVAGAMLVVGGVLQIVAMASGDAPPPANPDLPPGALGAGLDSGGTGGGGAGDDAAADDGSWSGGAFRLGLSFFVGLTMGIALRAFVKLVMIALGVAFFLLFLLSYFELITIDWQAIDGVFETLVERISSEAEQFRTFVTGSLPSAGMAGLGLFTGFKKDGRR